MKESKSPTKMTSLDPTLNLEKTMQIVSRVVSLLGLGLMVIGFADMILGGAKLSPPGLSALTLPKLANFTSRPFSTVTMSTGIILLAILPGIRVGLAFYGYLQQRKLVNSLVALIVLVELLISIRAGR